MSLFFFINNDPIYVDNIEWQMFRILHFLVLKKNTNYTILIWTIVILNFCNFIFVILVH